MLSPARRLILGSRHPVCPRQTSWAAGPRKGRLRWEKLEKAMHKVQKGMNIVQPQHMYYILKTQAAHS